jgi:hypothetical protein
MSTAPNLRCLFLASLAAVTAPLGARADVVIEWNIAMNHLNETLPPPGNPIFEARSYAMAHIAMFNAIVTADKQAASEEAAASKAAHDVLVKVLPAGTRDFDSLLATELAAIADGPGKSAGLAIGAGAATEILAARANDGIGSAEGPFKPGIAPGAYRFTPPFDGPPFNGYAYDPNLKASAPFVLKSPDQFRAPPPYSTRDPEYVFEFDEVKALGSKDSAVRSADQTQMAEFWYEMSMFGWNRIARTLAAQRTDSLLNHARLFAALNAAMIDGFIAGFETKYTYIFWRPITAIHEAANDDNNLTDADPNWQPLMPTPPMPDYISTHATVGAAASVVLIWFFNGDEHAFTIASSMSAQFPNLRPRSYSRISDAAVENAVSRVYAGIHFRFACVNGIALGRSVGAWVVQHSPYTESH